MGCTGPHNGKFETSQSAESVSDVIHQGKGKWEDLRWHGEEVLRLS